MSGKTSPPTLAEMQAAGVRYLMAHREMTETAIADVLGYRDASPVSRLLSGQGSISAEKAHRLARLCHAKGFRHLAAFYAAEPARYEPDGCIHAEVLEITEASGTSLPLQRERNAFAVLHLSDRIIRAAESMAHDALAWLGLHMTDTQTPGARASMPQCGEGERPAAMGAGASF